MKPSSTLDKTVEQQTVAKKLLENYAMLGISVQNIQFTTMCHLGIGQSNKEIIGVQNNVCM